MDFSAKKIVNHIVGIGRQLKPIDQQTLLHLQHVLYDMLVDITSYCKDLGIEVALCGGSCLGAVRHKGFIPWDDDLDIAITRKDWEQFKVGFNEALGEKYELGAPGYDNKDCCYPWGKIYLKGTEVIGWMNAEMPYPKGISVDVFVIEDVTPNRLVRCIDAIVAPFFKYVATSMLFYQYPNPLMKHLFSSSFSSRGYFAFRQFLGFLFSFVSHKTWVDWYDKFISRHQGDTAFLTIPNGTKLYKGEMLRREYFLPYSTGEFMGMKVCLPHDPDKYLRNLYGGNYMQLPPEDKRESHFAVSVKFAPPSNDDAPKCIHLKLPDGYLREENRDGYKVSSRMKKVWCVELDLLDKLMAICKKYNLRIYASGGTMLGAVRHQGIIPWDDDIDIMMFREDYDKLCDIAPTELSYPYFFQTEETDNGSYRGHAQLRNSETTGILKHEMDQKRLFNQGIFIDIFPLDNIPDDERTCRKHLRKIKWIWLAHRVCLLSSKPFKFEWGKEFKRSVALLLLNTFIPRRLATRKCDEYFHKTENLRRRYNKFVTNKIVMSPFYEKRWTWERSDFKSFSLMPFEMINIPVPDEKEKMLDITYGNWRQFVVGNSMHGGVFFDVDVPYTEYLKD